MLGRFRIGFFQSTCAAARSADHQDCAQSVADAARLWRPAPRLSRIDLPTRWKSPY